LYPEIIFAGYSSPRHSSEFSTASHHSNAGVEENSAAAAAADVNSSVGKRHMEDEEIPEEVIQFVSENPRIMRRWQSLAHQVTRCRSNRRPSNYQYLALFICQLMEGSVLYMSWSIQ
jgi:hypothetical protein